MTKPTDETPTPITDAAECEIVPSLDPNYDGPYRWVESHIARQLERELSACRAATVEECARVCEKGLLPTLDQPSWKEAIGSCAAAIRSLSASAGMPGWIAVTERLPDYDTDREHKGDTVSTSFEIRGTGRYHFPTDTWARLDYNITHWRPLAASPPTPKTRT